MSRDNELDPPMENNDTTTEQCVAADRCESALLQQVVSDLRLENASLIGQLQQAQEELEFYYLKALETGSKTSREKELSHRSTRGPRQVEQDLKKIKKRVELIETSTSWRLTAPVRAFLRRYRGKTKPNDKAPLNADLKELLYFYQNRLRSLESSASWRLTKPYRMLGDILRKGPLSLFGRAGNEGRTSSSPEVSVLKDKLKQREATIKSNDSLLHFQQVEIRQKDAQIRLMKAEVTGLEYLLVERQKAEPSVKAKDVTRLQQRLFTQLESFSWLQRRLAINSRLPPLRGWAASPDVLLELHSCLMKKKPLIVVELGSGASSVVIADALKQNGVGRLISIDHDQYYADKTKQALREAGLENWVDLRIGGLTAWHGNHLNSDTADKPSLWYPQELFEGITSIDLLWIDGPPGATCLYSRYPAVPALISRFSAEIEIWLDDSARAEEKRICEKWAEEYGLAFENLPMEKGLGRLIFHSHQ